MNVDFLFLVCLTFPIKFHEGKDLNLSKNFENSTHHMPLYICVNILLFCVPFFGQEYLQIFFHVRI